MNNHDSRFVALENFGYVNNSDKKQIRTINNVIGKLNYSDWLILYSLSQAMKKENFLELIEKLDDDFAGKPKRSLYQRATSDDYHSEQEDGSSHYPKLSPDSPDGTLKSKARLYGGKLRNSLKKN